MIINAIKYAIWATHAAGRSVNEYNIFGKQFNNVYENSKKCIAKVSLLRIYPKKN